MPPRLQTSGRSLWSGNVYIKRLHSGTQAPNYFAGPESAAENRQPAIFRFANSAKRIAKVAAFVSIQSATRKFPLQRSILQLLLFAGSYAKSFFFETFKNFKKGIFCRLRYYEATIRGLAKCEAV